MMMEDNNIYVIEFFYENSKYEYKINIDISRLNNYEFGERIFDYLWLKNDLKENVKRFIDSTKNPENSILNVFIAEQTINKTIAFYVAVVSIELLDVCLPFYQTEDGAFILCAGEDDPANMTSVRRRIKSFKDFSIKDRVNLGE